MKEYIERAALKRELAPYEENDFSQQMDVILAIVDAQPAADVAPVVHGKWEYNRDATDFGIGGYICSQCKNKNNNLPCNRVKSVQMFLGAKYCPECGAKMDAEQEEPTE